MHVSGKRHPTPPCRSTYHPAWGAGTFTGNVMTGAPVLAGTAQLTVSPMAPGRTQFFTAARKAGWLERADSGKEKRQ